MTILLKSELHSNNKEHFRATGRFWPGLGKKSMAFFGAIVIFPSILFENKT